MISDLVSSWEKRQGLSYFGFRVGGKVAKTRSSVEYHNLSLRTTKSGSQRRTFMHYSTKRRSRQGKAWIR